MSNPIFKLVKKILSLFPPTWPFKIYNIFLKVPPLKWLMVFIIRSLAPEQVNIPEGKILLDKKDPVMSGALSLGEYEPKTMELFRSSIKEGMTVIDIGANLGYFTVIAAKKVGVGGNVITYEPDPRNFDLLKKNIAVNDFQNTKAFAVALSDRAGTRELFFGDNQCTLSFGDKKGTGRSEAVTTDTLDNSLKILGVQKVDLIKMDIEGAEPIALEGMKETIERNPELIMFFEFHPNAIKRVGSSPLAFLQKMKAFGFSLSVIDEDKKSLLKIENIESFAESFHEKELSMNLIGIKNSR